MQTGLWRAAGTEWQGKLSPTMGMRFRFFLPLSYGRGLPSAFGAPCSPYVPTAFDDVVVVWARFAVERRAALRKLILPAISSCLHWFGLSENPEERFLSQSGFTSAIRKLIPRLHPSPASAFFLVRHELPSPLPAHVCIDYWKGTHWKFIRSRTHLRLESSCRIFGSPFVILATVL